MMKRFRNKEKRCTIFNKNKNPVMRITGFFYVLFTAEHFCENPDNNRNHKNYDKYPESHSGFKNVSNNFAACK